ncbi:hypothetical protein [Lactiplantibacillus plantarum]|nr:hypothetical protein [Lactiplantibacillus plantarum]
MKPMLGHLLMAGTLLLAGSTPIVANAAENRRDYGYQSGIYEEYVHGDAS